MSAEILSCGCPVPLDDDGCCTSCGWFPGMTEVATMTKPTPKQAVSAAPIQKGSHALAELRDLTECRCPADYKNRGRVACDCNHAYREDVEALAAALAASEARVLPLTNMLVLCGERECCDVEGLPEKLRALIDGLIHQRRRAEAAEQSLAEARKLLLSSVVAVHAAARDCRAANLPTAASQYDALARAIDALLPKGEGETS